MSKEYKVKLNLQESGTLCHLLMANFILHGGPSNQPQWALDLYAKLAEANDKAMFDKED